MADELIRRGVKVRGARFRSNGSILGELGLQAAGGRYGFDLGLSEEITESLLTRYLEDHGGAVTRGARLVAMDARAEHVVATVECDGAQRDLEASWIVGCDGFRSTVRRLARIDYPGTDLEIPWAVFDATLDGWDDDGDVCHPMFDDPAVILTPLPGKRWRVYLRPSSDQSDLVADATRTIHRYAPSVVIVDVENPNRFVCHSRVAARFRAGRIFLAGDAAHACSPSEGHGMNTGLQDAFNLGWKLALAWHGVGGPALLDSYEAERRPVALRIVATGDAFEGNQTMRAHDARAARDEDIRHMLEDPASMHQEAAAAAEIDRVYAESPVIFGSPDEQLAAGELLPNTITVLSPEGVPCALHELTHRTGHTVLVIGGIGATPEHVEASVVAQEDLARRSPVIDAVFAFGTTAGQDGVGEIDSAVARKFGLNGVTVLAVRPDRYIGFRDDGPGAAAMARYVERLTE